MYLKGNLTDSTVWNAGEAEINVTYSRQLSTIYLFGIISLRLTQEQMENRLYMKAESSEFGIIIKLKNIFF